MFIVALDFPLACFSYHGPHTPDCLTSIWEDVGCMNSGTAYPGRTDRFKELDSLNLR